MTGMAAKVYRATITSATLKPNYVRPKYWRSIFVGFGVVFVSVIAVRNSRSGDTTTPLTGLCPADTQ